MYPATGYPALPLCANDVQAVKKALIAGLNVSESSIMVCGHHGTATTKDLITGLYSSISGTDNEAECRKSPVNAGLFLLSMI